MTVSTGAMIEGPDVLVDLGRGDLPSPVDAFANPLLLQAAKKGFGDRVVQAVAPSTHTGFQVMRPAETPPRLAVKLGTLVGVNQSPSRRECASSSLF